MSALSKAATWAVKQFATTALSRAGHHVGEGIGNVIKRKIDPPPPKEESKDAIAASNITDAELVP